MSLWTSLPAANKPTPVSRAAFQWPDCKRHFTRRDNWKQHSAHSRCRPSTNTTTTSTTLFNSLEPAPTSTSVSLAPATSSTFSSPTQVPTMTHVPTVLSTSSTFQSPSQVSMEYTKKMALVDPRILENIQPQRPSPANPIERVLQRLDNEMLDILERSDIYEREKVVLYNQVLSRYNDLSDKRMQEPVRVVVEKIPSEEKNKVQPANENEVVEKESIENEIIDSVPKTMKQKARRLLDKIKGAVSWNDRGEMMYRNKAVPGSNIVDLVNDVLRKRKSFEPVGWETFARGLKDVNTPMDLVGNSDRWLYMQTASVDDDISKETSIPFDSGRRRNRRRPSSSRRAAHSATPFQITRWEPY